MNPNTTRKFPEPTPARVVTILLLGMALIGMLVAHAVQVPQQCLTLLSIGLAMLGALLLLLAEMTSGVKLYDGDLLPAKPKLSVRSRTWGTGLALSSMVFALAAALAPAAKC